MLTDYMMSRLGVSVVDVLLITCGKSGQSGREEVGGARGSQLAGRDMGHR